MKKFLSHHRKGRNAFLIILLALVCVSGAELIAIHHFSPALYARICAPVHAAWDAAANFAEQLSDDVSEEVHAIRLRIEEAKAAAEAAKAAKEAAEAEAQLATEPMLVDNTIWTDPSDTELITEDDQEILTGGSIDITYFNQGDPAWATQAYGRDQIGSYGCGPTAMAMVISSMTDELVDPAAMAKVAVQRGYWASHSGSYCSIVPGLAEAYGLSVESLSERTVETLNDAMISGKIVVALMGPGHFTKSGHFILLRGITLGGKILVADPNSRERSLTAWDPQLILDELSKNTSNGGPLWALSIPED